MSTARSARELPPEATAGLRPTIVESWRRSLATGLDPTDSLAPIEADESEVLERWFEHPLGSLTHVLTEQLQKLAEESRSVVVVTDASGLVLHRVGDEWLKERAAEMNLVEGARYSEAADGTNGIGTALAADHAFQVFAFEHFNQRHHEWVCSGAPVHDPVSGRLIGLIDLSSLWKIAHPRSLELVTTAARTIEQCLLEVRRDHDARLRRRYGDLMTRSTDLLVNRDGYVLAGAERAHSKPLDVPEGGGEIVLGDGSVAVAASLGQGEAYLLRRVAARHARSAPVEVLERAEDAPSRARHRTVRLAAGRDPRRARVVSRSALCRRRRAGRSRLRRPARQAGPLRAGRLGRGRRLQRGRSRALPDRIALAAGQPGCNRNRAADRSARPRRGLCAPDRGDRCGRSWRGNALGRREPDRGRETPVGGDGGSLAAGRAFPRETRRPGSQTSPSSSRRRSPTPSRASRSAARRRAGRAAARGDARRERRRPGAVFQPSRTRCGRLFALKRVGHPEVRRRRTATTLGSHGGLHAPGTRHPIDPDFVMGSVRRRGMRRGSTRTTRPPRACPRSFADSGARSTVASPIVVDGDLWGAIGVGSFVRSLPPGTERGWPTSPSSSRQRSRTPRLATQVRALADEQAALRRVATLRREGAAPAERLRGRQRGSRSRVRL